MQERILLVEDDSDLGRQIESHLKKEGYAVDWLRDGTDALLEDPSPYSLVVLDLMLPGAYGLDVLKRYREQYDVPVLILSARNETPDKVRALKLGADDYVTKPFWPEELVARVAARLRRPVLQRETLLRAGRITIDVDAHRAEVDGEPVSLTQAEFDVLCALARRAGAAVTREWLVDEALDPEREGGARTLDVHISRLRKKLGPAGGQIETVWGIGYRLELEPKA
ncbi:MAG: response regulator transcription factor [Planctomycetota bacterium]